MQLKKMTATRDKANNVQRWSTTALRFTASAHKPKDKFYWAAARWALIVFDWMGYGRNRAKLASHSPVQQAHGAKCRQYGTIDSQQHMMLQCKHGHLVTIRATACTKQKDIASNLQKDHTKSQNLQHFVKQCINYSGSSSTAKMQDYDWENRDLKESLTTPMKISTREIYIKYSSEKTYQTTH
jgi:hypothetical protein